MTTQLFENATMPKDNHIPTAREVLEGMHYFYLRK